MPSNKAARLIATTNLCHYTRALVDQFDISWARPAAYESGHKFQGIQKVGIRIENAPL